MEIPKTLENALEEEIKNKKISELKQRAKLISDRYMNNTRTGNTLLNEYEDALVYSFIRMPATYCANFTALKYTLELAKSKIDSVIDVGTGTGSMVWAIYNYLNINNITCIERENVMKTLAQKLMNSIDLKVNWQDKDIVKENINEKADLVTACYMLNEIKKENRYEVINKLFQNTNDLLLIVEPGTPDGFEIIKQVQEYAINNKAYIVAPCTSQNICQLPKDDWCHSTVRVQRNKIHKYLKEGTISYEDEKFSYIAISKQKTDMANQRILRHPIIENGKIKLKLCENGKIIEKIITKTQKELFKFVKKKKCGDSIN